MNVTVGDEAIDFTLPDAAGQAWSLADLRGRPVVLYFYPRDNTSGCTNQACGVRDAWSEFEERGAVVVGISPDSSKSHAGFAERHGLPHTLLADTDRTVIERYGATKTKPDGSVGVRRSSVVIDAQGMVAAVSPDITPEEQAPWSLRALEELGAV